MSFSTRNTRPVFILAHVLEGKKKRAQALYIIYVSCAPSPSTYCCTAIIFWLTRLPSFRMNVLMYKPLMGSLPSFWPCRL